jgi:hypothetical protein
LRYRGLRDRQPRSAIGLFQPVDADRRWFRAAQCGGKADPDQGAVALAAQLVLDGRQQLLDNRGRPFFSGN